MGDIADMLFDQGWDQMCDHDYDGFGDNYYSGGRSSYVHTPLRCKHCGSRDVVWLRSPADRSWFMADIDTHAPHLCPEDVDDLL